MGLIERLIAEAEQKATEVVTITRCDGTTYCAPRNYGSAVDGRFQVYVVPVQQRTTIRQSHYRATYYLMGDEGTFKRVSRAAFAQAATLTEAC